MGPTEISFVQMGGKIIIRTDHKALTFLKTCKLLRQGPALEGRNSPVFAKRFW